ncbi:hypothetical protein [Dyadobacter pollutisoli]|jgi:hypothetical protein|uniref:Uncharacterized protein n=1 Tax=Dyadobacter pollutisoli TaxID=2910158 RepID=A0A9E8ND41_9BACT|nr:hypothetical protein [Dyadobacter pollutisoli]WAC12786.1 hypothetical protein ON006_02240 [Dyadobacter pollutisoli]
MEGLNSFLQIGAFVIAMMSLYKALSEYGMNNSFKRAEVLEKLIAKFNDKEIYAAKRLLDDFEKYHFTGIDPANSEANEKKLLRKYKGRVTFVHNSYDHELVVATRGANQSFDLKIFIGKIASNEAGYIPNPKSVLCEVAKEHAHINEFKIINLKRVLRSHIGDVIYDDEVYFRDSFDKLLDFILLLIYYLRNEIITIQEVHAHFLFTLQQVRSYRPLNKYIKLYYNEADFEWLYEQLPESKITSGTGDNIVAI